MNRCRIIWLVVIVGFAVRLLLVTTTIGTTDVVFWTFGSNPARTACR